MYPNQLPIFKELSPYSGGIDTNNRWIKLASLIPWEEMDGIYRRSFSKCKQSVIKPGRLILGLMIGEMFVQTDEPAKHVKELQRLVEEYKKTLTS